MSDPIVPQSLGFGRSFFQIAIEGHLCADDEKKKPNSISGILFRDYLECYLIIASDSQQLRLTNTRHL